MPLGGAVTHRRAAPAPRYRPAQSAARACRPTPGTLAPDHGEHMVMVPGPIGSLARRLGTAGARGGVSAARCAPAPGTETCESRGRRQTGVAVTSPPAIPRRRGPAAKGHIPLSTNEFRCSIRSPEDLLGAVPYVLGFHPEDSFVVLLLDAQGGLYAGARADLDTPIGELAAGLRKQCGPGTHAVMVLGYGHVPDPERLNELIRALRRDVVVADGWWVTADEYYCVTDGCDCSARHGVRFEPRATVSAATLTAQGNVALASRGELLAELVPDPAAQQRVQALLEHQDTRIVFTLDDALRLAEKGQRLTDAQVAALVIALRTPQVREQAWRATNDQPWQRQLWFDLTRRVPDAHVAAVATLAAWWCWRTGHDMHARQALVRVFTHSAPITLTLIVSTLVTARIDPAGLPWPLTAEETHGLITLRTRSARPSGDTGRSPAAGDSGRGRR
ncbi:DUF4192 domain-containing protein [Actinoplanes sp. NPDC000266]